MSRAEDIRAAQESLNSRDWSDAVVDDTPPTTRVSMSARYPSDIVRALAQVARRERPAAA